LRRGMIGGVVVCLLVFPAAHGQPSKREPATSQRPARAGLIERAIEEFKIQTRNLGHRPESRRAQRGPRPGWHGRLFWNLRNDFLDAVPHEVRQTGGEKGLLRRNQYGFNVAGPVLIPKIYRGVNRTFFSISYEGMREKLGQHFIRTVPTLPERAGDFSTTVDKAGELLPIYDPWTTRRNPDFDPRQPVSRSNLEYLREPFPGNRIPDSRLDPVARQALRYYPEPNAAIGPFFQNNYVVYAPEVNRANGARGNIDHSLGESQRLTFGFSFSNGFESPARLFPTVANPGRPDREFQSRSGYLQHVWTLSPSRVSTTRFSTWKSLSRNLPELLEGTSPFPVYRLGPYVSMGRSFPLSKTGRGNFQLSQQLSLKQGSHSWRIALEWRRERAHSYWPQYPSGRFNFSEGLTSLPGIVNTGHAFASFLLGLADSAERTVVEHPSYFRAGGIELGIRDEWEATEGVTVNLGLGLDISTPRVEKFNRQSTVDLSVPNPVNGRPGALIFAGRNGVGRAFQPVRVRPEGYLSIAWSPWKSRNTVLRFSLRRDYTAIPLYSGQWGTQGFVATPTAISPNKQLEPAAVLQDGPPEPDHPLPDLRPEAANDTVADLIDRSPAQPMYSSAGLSVERELPGALLVAVGLAHTEGKSMLASNAGVDLNAIPLDALIYRDLLNEEAFRRQLRPFPQYQGFDVYSAYPIGRYQRDEAYLRVEKRTTQGLSIRLVYEFSKQLDDYASPDGLQDYYHRRKEWALTYYNDPHRLSLTYMYELPFGPNRALLKVGDWKKYLVEGWSISGTTTYSSGDPLSLRAVFNNTGGVVKTLYVNAVPGVDPRVPERGPQRWFNPEAFVNPPDFTIGNVSRTHPQLYNPSRQNHDLAVTKRFPIGADRALEFTGTALNFLNHANWNRPDTEIGTKESPNVNAGRIIGSRGGRVIQLGLRFTF